jgi:hypothetical protein
MTVEIQTTVIVSPSPVSYLQQFICELHYAPGKKRPEVFWLPRDTQPGTTQVINNQFIFIVEKLNKPL